MTTCPKCGKQNVEEIIVTGDYTDEGLEAGKSKLDLYPDIRPCEAFECVGCGIRWVNPKFEEYLLHRAVKT